MNKLGQKLLRFVHLEKTPVKKTQVKEPHVQIECPLPKDCLTIIFSHLTLSTLARVDRTCKAWHVMAGNTLLLAKKIRNVIFDELIDQKNASSVPIQQFNLWIGFDPDPKMLGYISQKTPIQKAPKTDGTHFLLQIFLNCEQKESYNQLSAHIRTNVNKYSRAGICSKLEVSNLKPEQLQLINGVCNYYRANPQELSFTHKLS